MPTRAERPPRARREFLAAARWIAQDSPSAARGWRAAVLDAGGLLGEHPLAGSVRPELGTTSLRFLTLQRFPYVLAYNPEAQPPLIVRILHAAPDLPTALAE